MHELVIRNGTIVDGTGAPAFAGDIAIDDGKITAVGQVGPEAARTIDATGRLVTPGFVDIHTHFDGQATWDPLLTPTSWHGVTTIVMGNCGVGFAPVAQDRQEWLIGLMEGVEDIPGTALYEGIQWQWETFPEYLDFLAKREWVVDIGTQVPHGAVRAYVMGERGAANEPANPEDIQEMARIVKEGIQAGALGFSTSRTIAHRAIDGRNVPGTFAAEDEMLGLGKVMGELGTGIFELAAAGVTGDDLSAPAREVAWMRKFSKMTGRPVTFALVQHNSDPNQWREMLRLSEEAARDGAQLRPQAHGRAVGGLFGLTARHPFEALPTWKAELKPLSFEDKLARMRDPKMKARLMEEVGINGPALNVLMDWSRIFPITGDSPDYEPLKEDSVLAQAEREGRTAPEVFYDWMLERDGRQIMLAQFLNYSDYSLDPAREMLTHPYAALGLSDGGAHCGAICDASVPTFMLSYWARDRVRGEKLPLEWVVKKQTLDTATLFGIYDRGVLKPGYRADLNVIDYANLGLAIPEMVYDLPANGRRFTQRSHGYDYTIAKGLVTFRNGEPTGERPGRLLRGEQRLAAAAR